MLLREEWLFFCHSRLERKKDDLISSLLTLPCRPRLRSGAQTYEVDPRVREDDRRAHGSARLSLPTPIGKKSERHKVVSIHSEFQNRKYIKFVYSKSISLLYKSFHVELDASMSAIFQERFHFFSCFSLLIASNEDSKVS